MTAVAPASSAEVAAPAAPAAPARVAAVLAVLVALVGAVLGPTGGLEDLFSPTSAIVGDGVVERQDGDEWEVVPTGGRVADGAVLRTPDGVAELLLPGGTIGLADSTELVVGDPLRVTAGTVVVRDVDFAVDAGGAVADGEGTWRWDATGRLAAYDGSVVLADASGRDTLVRSLEQLRVRDAVVAEGPRPYVYANADPFDRRHVADAIGVDDYLAALRQGLTGDYGTAPQPTAFYTDFDGLDGALVAALGDVGFDRDGARFGPPADVLVAAVVTDALVVDAGLTPQAAADEARTRRLAGATWGIVSQAHDLDASHVRAAAERALTLRQQAEDAGDAVPPVTPADDDVDEPATSDPGPDTAAAPPAPSGDDGGDPDGAPPPSDEPDDQAPEDGEDGEDGLLGSIVDDSGAGDAVDETDGDVGGLVDDLVDAGDGLLDGLGDDGDDTGSGSTSDSDGLLDTTGDVVGGAVDAVEGAVGSVLGN